MYPIIEDTPARETDDPDRRPTRRTFPFTVGARADDVSWLSVIVFDDPVCGHSSYWRSFAHGATNQGGRE